MRCAYFSFQPFLDQDPRGQTCASAALIDGVSSVVDVDLIYFCADGDLERVESRLLGRFPNLRAVSIHKYGSNLSIGDQMRCAFRLLPFSLAHFFDPSVRDVVAAIHADSNFDVVHYDIMFWLFVHPQKGEMVKPTVCSGTDAYSLAYLGKSRFRKDVLGKLRARLAVIAFSRFEDRYLPKADIVHMLSQRDVEYLRNRGVGAEFRLTNLPLESKWFSDPHSERPKSFQRRILLSGQHTHAWYRQGVIRFLRSMWPRIRQRYPEADLTIHSSDKSAAIEQIVSTMPRARTLGYVEDFRELFQQHDYFLHPLFFGTGQKNRLAIAMAQGLCCIATDEAVEGMNLRPNTDYVLVDMKSDSSIERALNVLGNRSLSAQIAKTGRRRVQAQYSVRSVGEAITNMYSEAITVV